MMVHSGPARCFNCEEDASEAILGSKKLKQVMLNIRYEGPKGGLVCVKCYSQPRPLQAYGLGSSVATDYRRTRFRVLPKRRFYRTRFS